MPGLLFTPGSRRLSAVATIRRPTRWIGAIEPNLIQGAQVMAVTGMRLANSDALSAAPAIRLRRLRDPSRQKDAPGECASGSPWTTWASSSALSDPQTVSGRQVDRRGRRPAELRKESHRSRAGAGGRGDGQESRADAGTSRRWSAALVADRRPAGLRRRSRGPARTPGISSYVMPMNGGDSDASPTRRGVQHFAWKPDGTQTRLRRRRRAGQQEGDRERAMTPSRSATTTT